MLEATERFRRDTGGVELELPAREDWAGRVWAFDEGAAAEYALIVVERREVGKPISTMDAQIAAIARSRGAALATRDIAGLTCAGLTVINPWT